MTRGGSTLVDLCEEGRTITYGVVKPGPVVEDGVLFIRGGDVQAGRINAGELRTISNQLSEQYRRTILRGGELVVSLVGNPGEVAIVPNELAGANLARQVGLVPLSPEVNAQFVMYYLQSHQGRGQLFTRTGGAVQQVINLRELKTVVVPDTPRTIQDRIADILSAYDDLIANNRRRIELLEQSARLLYKEWFVHLRFPGHEHVKIVDGVPEGWERKPFSELAEYLNGFAFKPSHLGEQGIPVIKIPELRDGPTSKTPRNTGENIPEKYLINNGDLLFSWSGTLLVNFWNFGPGLLNQHLFKVTPTQANLRCLVYFALQQALLHFHNQTTGATMKHIRKSALTSVVTMVPPKLMLNQFELAASPMLAQIGLLQRQITASAKARDLLLPRLMNGEIAV